MHIKLGDAASHYSSNFWGSNRRNPHKELFAQGQISMWSICDNGLQWDIDISSSECTDPYMPREKKRNFLSDCQHFWSFVEEPTVVGWQQLQDTMRTSTAPHEMWTFHAAGEPIPSMVWPRYNVEMYLVLCHTNAEPIYGTSCTIRWRMNLTRKLSS